MLSAGSTQQHWPFPSGSAEETGYAYILTHPGIPCIMWEHYFDHGFGGCIKHLVEVRYVAMSSTLANADEVTKHTCVHLLALHQLDIGFGNRVWPSLALLECHTVSVMQKAEWY